MARRDHVWTAHDDGSIVCRRCHVALPASRGVPCQATTKYHNEPVVVDGLRFDSKAEARYWEFLCDEERAGRICQLERQFRIPLVVNGDQVGVYVADFRIEDPLTGVKTYIDVKGGEATKTQVYRLKKKLVKALYGIAIHEVTT